MATTPDPRAPIPTSYFSVVVTRNKQGKFLAVLEINDRGWWLPAGRVEPGETFAEAALRETQEEAGIQVELVRIKHEILIIQKGILRVEHTPGKTHQRMRVVYYAEPVDENAPLKSIADKESIRAEWMTLEQIKSYEFKPPGLRGEELMIWAQYLESGGQYYPLTLLDREIAPAPKPQGSSSNDNSNPPSKKKGLFGFG